MVALVLLVTAACTYAPAPKAEFGEGPPAKFLVGDAKGADAAALSDASSKADASALDGPRLDGDAAVDSPPVDAVAEVAETSDQDGEIADTAPEDVDPPDLGEDAIEPDSSLLDAAATEVADAADVAKSPGFGEVWTKVIAKFGCAAAFCHGSTAPQPIFPNQGMAYALLLQESGTAKGCVGLPLVTVGQPEESLLWLKIAPDTPSCGAKMPVTAENNGLDAASAALVEAWIKGGAKP